MSSSLGANPVTALTELLCAVRELLIPVILELVDHHCQHWGHRVVSQAPTHNFHLGSRSWWQFPEPQEA